jgi:hypothetical protein
MQNETPTDVAHFDKTQCRQDTLRRTTLAHGWQGEEWLIFFYPAGKLLRNVQCPVFNIKYKGRVSPALY